MVTPTLTLTDTNGAVLHPILWHRYEATRESRTIIHETAAGTPIVTRRPAASRSCRVRLLFDTELAANVCELLHRDAAGAMTIADTDLPSTGMQYVVNGRVIVAQEPDYPDVWFVEIDAYDVTPRKTLNEVAPWVEQARNLFTNPRLVGDGTWAEVRRNLATNPNSESAVMNAAGSGSGTASRVTTIKHSGSHSTKYVHGSGGWGASLTVGPHSASPSEVITASAYVYWESGAAPSFGPYTQDFDIIGGSTGIKSPTVMGEWQRIYVTFTIPAGASGYRVYDLRSSASVYYVDDVLIEKSSVLEDYFDGNSPFGSVDPDMRQRWLGAANASESVMEIERVRIGPVPNYWRGVYGVSSGGRTRFINNHTASTSTTLLNAVGRIASVVPGATYTLRAKITNNTSGTRSRIRAALRVYAATTQFVEVSPPMLAGETREVTLQLPAPVDAVSWADLLFGVEEQVPYLAGLLIEDIALFAGEYDGPNIHGSMPSDALHRYRWADAVDNSASIEERRVLNGAAG